MKLYCERPLHREGCICGDFDQDGKKGWFAKDNTGKKDITIWECNDNYKQVWKDSGKPTQAVWLGNDTDGDGKPEIFLWDKKNLSMYEAIGDNAYEYKVIDTVSANDESYNSTCGDIDGDGREEVIVANGMSFVVYKAIGDDKYERVGEWKWRSDRGFYSRIGGIGVRCHDFNKNGYDEIVVSITGITIILEIDKASIEERFSGVQVPRLTISPNPAKGMIDIRYEIPDKHPISLNLYDASGRLVKILAKIQSPEPGAYKLRWDGRDDRGNLLSSGIYFCVLKMGKSLLREKVILLK